MSRARRVFDLLERGLPPLAARWPRPAYAAAALLGAQRNRLSRRWPSPEQVLALFPRLGRPDAERVAWEIAGNEARNRLLIEVIRRGGPAPVRPLVRTAEEVFAPLRPPLVLGMFHSGTIQALNVAVERLPGRVLVLRQGALYPSAPPVEVASTDGDGQHRAAAFRRALLHLKEGGFVILALDVVQGPGLPVACLGHPLELARGPLALARLTGAPLRPIVARWEGGRIGIVVGGELADAPGLAAPERGEGARRGRRAVARGSPAALARRGGPGPAAHPARERRQAGGWRELSRTLPRRSSSPSRSARRSSGWRILPLAVRGRVRGASTTTRSGAKPTERSTAAATAAARRGSESVVGSASNATAISSVAEPAAGGRPTAAAMRTPGTSPAASSISRGASGAPPRFSSARRRPST